MRAATGVGAAPDGVLGSRLDSVIDSAKEQLKALQRPDGEWSFELEADATIPSEYIILQHFLDEVEPEIEKKIAA